MKHSLLSTALCCSISSGDALETEHNPPQSPYIVPALDEDSDLPLDARDPSVRNEHPSEHLADALTFDLNFFDLDYIDDNKIGRIAGSGFCCIFDDFDLFYDESLEACSFNDFLDNAV